MADISVASGSQVLRTYREETTNGTAAVGAYETLRSVTGVNFNLKRNTFQSNEIRADRQVPGLTYGIRSGELSIPIEWSYGSFDAFLEAVLGGTWSTDVLNIGNTKRTFTFEEKNTDIGTLERLTGCELSSFTIAQQADAMVTGDFKGVFRDAKIAQTSGVNLAYDSSAKTITRASAGFITIDGWVVGDGVCGLGNADSGNNNTTPWVITTLTDTVMTFTTATGIVTASSTSGITLDLGTVATSVNPAATTTPYDSFTGSISEGGASTSLITGWNMTLSQEITLLTPLGYAAAQGSSKGVVTVSGQITAYLADMAMRKKFANGISTSLSLLMGGSAYGGTAQFDLGTVYMTSNSKSSDLKEVIQTIDYTATYTDTDGTLKITRTAA